jgi:hypothetical protein
MSDDIVTRLRERAEERKEANDKYWRGYKFDYEIPELEDKAADEIERLRAEILEINLLWNADKARLERLQRLNDCDMCSEITDYRCYEHRENTPKETHRA